MVRTLLTGKPHAKGDHTATWDGLDRYGNALPAGDYTWKLLATEGLRAEFITQVGQNVDPAWEKATGNHQSPNAAGHRCHRPLPAGLDQRRRPLGRQDRPERTHALGERPLPGRSVDRAAAQSRWSTGDCSN